LGSAWGLGTTAPVDRESFVLMNAGIIPGFLIKGYGKKGGVPISPGNGNRYWQPRQFPASKKTFHVGESHTLR
jgi:hypothetical protein